MKRGSEREVVIGRFREGEERYMGNKIACDDIYL